MRKKALEDILDQEYETLPSYDKLLDRLKIAVFRDVLTGSVQPLEKKLSAFRDQIYACAESGDTMELIRIIDSSIMRSSIRILRRKTVPLNG